MPNYCDTTYKAVGNEQQVKKFYDLAMKAWNNINETNGWLGYLVHELNGNAKDVYCRGWIRDKPILSSDGKMCEIRCETAWSEPTEWRHFIEEKINGLLILYTAVEPGCGVYLTNDENIAGMWVIDSCKHEGNNEEFSTEKEVIDFVNEMYKQSFTTIEECINYQNEVNDNDNDDFLYINQMEYAD